MMHTQLKKDVANDYSKGNQDAYPPDIHKALTLMNEYKPLKLDNPMVAAQGTGSKSKKYYSDAELKALSSEAQTKIINERKKAMDDADDERSAASAKSSKSFKSLTKTMKALEKDNRRLKNSVSVLQKCNEDDDNDSSLSSVEGSTHFQEAVETLRDSYPKIALALKSKKSMGLDLRNVILLDNQSTFDLCCNRKFTSSVKTAVNALNMTSNGEGLRISEKCKFPEYKFWVWLSKKAITNIICHKNLIKIYK
jgi:hypothetical protein